MTPYENNPYHPFPAEMRGLERNGPHCEIKEGDYIRFISIYHQQCSKDTIQRSQARGLYDDSGIQAELDLVEGGYNIDELYFIYKLESYRLEKNLLPIQDTWTFNNQIQDYRRYVFVDLNKLVAFCQETWGVNLSDFVSIDKTHIPQ